MLLGCAQLVLAAATASAAAPRPAAVPATGDLELLVVLAGFPDRPLGKPREHFTGKADSLVDRLVAYYAEVSAGRLRIVPTVGETVVTLPRPRVMYVGQPAAIATDALRAYARAATTPADQAAIRAAKALVVFFAGSGRESHTANAEPNDPWSNYTTLLPGPTTLLPGPAEAGSALDDACVIAEEEVPPFSSFGVLCHEFGHLLGLPELYAPGAATNEGIGIWGLMGQGTWLGRGDRPPHMSAWEKLKLGWVDAETITKTTLRVELPAVEQTPRVIRIPAVPENPFEYYLLENRAKLGADASLPGEGLLVWHVDERVSGFRTAQSNPAHKLLHLVEADGRGDLDRGHAAGGNRGDRSDPWQGPPRWRRGLGALLALAGAITVAAAVFRAVRPRPLAALGLLLVGGALLAGGAFLRRTPVCGAATPGMAPYDGGPARVTIRNISPPGPVMRLDVLVASD